MLKRIGAVPAAVALVLAAQASARADAPGAGDPFLSQIECGQDGGAGCDITLRWEDYKEGTSGGGGEPETPESPPSKWDAVDWDAVDWDSVDWDAVDWDSVDWESIDYGEDAEEEVPANPELLIAESMDSFELPQPAISSSPSPDSLILVTTPVWLWVDEGAWVPATAEADVPGLSLELTATPSTTRWTMGDGEKVSCDGPGTAFDPNQHAPDSASPDCGHVYAHSSQSEPDGTYTVTADITWNITWELATVENEDADREDGEEENAEDGENAEDDQGEVETGQLDTVVTSSQVNMEVRESQGLVTGSGA